MIFIALGANLRQTSYEFSSVEEQFTFCFQILVAVYQKYGLTIWSRLKLVTEKPKNAFIIRNKILKFKTKN